MANKARDFVARFISDTSKFDTDEPVRDLDRLADQATTTERRMDDSFDRIKRSSDSNLDQLGHDGKSRAADAGAEIGSELAANIGESIGSGQANIADTIAGTLGGLVAVPGLGAVAAGLGVAGLFAKGIIDGVRDSKAKIAEATQRAVDSIDVDMSKFAAKFDVGKFFDASLEALTEGGLEQDVAKFQDLAKKTVGEDTLTRILAGEATPADRAALTTLIGQTALGVDDLNRKGLEAQKAQFVAAQETLRLLDDQAAARERGTDAVDATVRAQQRLNGYIETSIGLISQAEAATVGGHLHNLPTDDR